MSAFEIIGTSEDHWHDNEYDDEENHTRLKYEDMTVRVRMFFNQLDVGDGMQRKISVDEDFPMPVGMDHHTPYTVLGESLNKTIVARMLEIHNKVDHVKSELVPNQREVVKHEFVNDEWVPA